MSYAQYCRLNLHVSASNRKVVKRAHLMLRPAVRYAHKHRADRHAWLRSILQEHANARKLFGQVATGRFG